MPDEANTAATLERMIVEERTRQERIRNLGLELRALTEEANRIAQRYRRAQVELDELKAPWQGKE